MKYKMNPNAVNQLLRGTEIYTEGEAVSSIALIIKGRIRMQNDCSKIIVNSGMFIGVSDLYAGSYQFTCTAVDDVILYIFDISRVEMLEDILSINKDYHGLMVASLNRIVSELDKIYHSLTENGISLYSFLQEQYTSYSDTAAKLGYTVEGTKRINTLEPLLLKKENEPDKAKISYYKECSTLPIDVVKSYFSFGNSITLYQIEDQVSIVKRLLRVLLELTDKVTVMAEFLIDDSDTCLFQLLAALGLEIANADGSNKQIMDDMDNIIERINILEKLYDQMLGRELNVDRKRMEAAYHLLLSGTKEKDVNIKTSLKYTPEDVNRITKELEDSYRKLLLYADLDSDKIEEMLEVMNSFVNMKDRMSGDNNSRAIRRQITDQHYLLYQSIFIKAYKEKTIPRIVEMFLRYGYADERLLPKEYLLSLYSLKEIKPPASEFHVYNIMDWLKLIYEGKKQPSKNEFDQDYQEMLASLKKQGRFSDKELQEWMVSPERKLEYEIQNMFKYNNRIANGQISTFVPVLHKDIVINLFDKSYISPSVIIEAIRELLRIDYSVFDREILYSNKDKNIVKEYIIKRVYPDIIMMPTVGINGVMWQEITGKKRDSAGRFILPLFCESNISSILVKLLGRFRWEMCRSIEGMSWNDITNKSLTSEYSDYLQFYRKNRELSEERKEKVKLQIQRGRNSREIFVIDYEQWINYESTGAIKLNKPVREIMATYCPFGKEIRELLMIQPMFEEAFARYNREKLRKLRELEGRQRLLQKDQIEITKEIADTLNYYKDT